ncbi:MAG: hypothetical protein Q8P49_00985 [Candidatus Liptonbacteria bacterium]|nr:hypothetical protein [Candidatus Liptonbacteria bacterium]
MSMLRGGVPQYQEKAAVSRRVSAISPLRCVMPRSQCVKHGFLGKLCGAGKYLETRTGVVLR